MIDREKVARAIGPQVFYLFDGDTMDRALDWGRHSQKERAEVQAIADAAIQSVLEQLREPSPGMVRAGEYDDYTHPDDGPGRYITPGMAKDCWQRMLDAAFPTSPSRGR